MSKRHREEIELKLWEHLTLTVDGKELVVRPVAVVEVKKGMALTDEVRVRIALEGDDRVIRKLLSGGRASAKRSRLASAAG